MILDAFALRHFDKQKCENAHVMSKYAPQWVLKRDLCKYVWTLIVSVDFLPKPVGLWLISRDGPDLFKFSYHKTSVCVQNGNCF